jgi:hypothetical protein
MKMQITLKSFDALFFEVALSKGRVSGPAADGNTPSSLPFCARLLLLDAEQMPVGSNISRAPTLITNDRIRAYSLMEPFAGGREHTRNRA